MPTIFPAKPVHFEADGLLARVVQHETDHLNGKLFIDRLSDHRQLEVRDTVREFEIQFDQPTRTWRSGRAKRK